MARYGLELHRCGGKERREEMKRGDKERSREESRQGEESRREESHVYIDIKSMGGKKLSKIYVSEINPR